MEQNAGRAIVNLTEEEIFASWSSLECPACSNPKSKASAFCKSCTYALPIWVRSALSSSPKDVRYLETFNGALGHLRLNAHRIKRVGWDFKSLAEIEEAGYRLLSTSHCRAVGCGLRIGWIENSVGKKIPIDIDTCQLHRMTCKNPGVFHQPRVKTSAQRRKGRR